jgi:hypothetical protein
MADEDAPLACVRTTSASARGLFANLATVRGATDAPSPRAESGDLPSLAAAASRALDELIALAVPPAALADAALFDCARAGSRVVVEGRGGREGEGRAWGDQSSVSPRV